MDKPGEVRIETPFEQRMREQKEREAAESGVPLDAATLAE